MLKILYVASEAVPFIKTGGLADVAFALPKALRKLGVDIRVIIPKYKDIPEKYKREMKFLTNFEVNVGWRRQYCGIEYLKYEGIPFYFIDNEYYFKRDGLYGHYDDGERFAYLCRAVLETIENIDFMPDIIHCNDWHTGMIPVLLNEHYKKYGKLTGIKTIFTIHNLKYQGIFGPEILGDLLSLGMEYYNPQALEFYGGVSFMKGGIKYSNIITTVSKTYAQEIQHPFFGERLDGLLRWRKNDLYGIVNGIDYDIYNPSKDKYIFEKYDYDSIEKKEINKLKLQESLNLPKRKDVPLISMVSRLVNMKGLDLVLHVLDEILSEDVQMIILGTGKPEYEWKLKEFAYKYPNKFSANIFFNEELAHKIYAASDIFLMPSLFEPCGLGQLIALRYGVLPVVRETGGLNDTVNSFNEYTGEGNGFSFTNYNAHDMLYTIRRALNFYKNKNTWKKIVKRAMIEDYSWNNSAKEYKKLYEKLTTYKM
ncbi:starch synthase [Caminicella sporogenes DSM 14501]|uniref:Glycogen synthase n=1 Tax=Caminicella sporogenes DSM 14501 TaxID=1121266 RepID=A0A1M6SWD1_9FIRM|nr:glycogen synthase GlgA [Caminicella sporogenes]RKD21923.1 starch synthase [Caminicella sporogenes]SHK49062.1 starch synthase [Caminicella sporogenes DSM 14501]